MSSTLFAVTSNLSSQKLISTPTNESTCTPAKIGWNSLHWFMRYGVHNVYGLLHAVTLTFNFLTLKSNQHIYEPMCICDQNWVKFPSFVFEIWCSQVLLDCCLLWPWPLTHESNQHIYEPICTGDQNWVTFPSFVWDIVFTRFSVCTLTHSLTHRQTDRNAVFLYGTIFQQWQRHKNLSDVWRGMAPGSASVDMCESVYRFFLFFYGFRCTSSGCCNCVTNSCQ